MLIKHFFPGSAICIMKRPTFARLCFKKRQHRARSRHPAARCPAPSAAHPIGTLSFQQRLEAAPQKPWDGFTGDETCFVLFSNIPWFLYAPAPFPVAAALLRTSRGDEGLSCSPAVV